jgi:hypothetical protein
MTQAASDTKKWLWIYAVHNLTLKEPLDTEYLALVPHSDPRLQPIVATSPVARCLIENFTNQQGRHRNPSVLILREDAPESVRNIDAIVSFRNLIAVPCVIFGWQQSMGALNVWGTLYSDYFDFYPTTISKDGKYASTVSSALNAFGEPGNIHGQTSPELPSTEMWGAQYDEDLVGVLAEVWKELYVGTKRFKREANTLFRSLQVAYGAAAMPRGNVSSIYDWGVRVAAWVSACEILAHPKASRGTGNTGFMAVKELLEREVWSRHELRRRKYCITYAGKRHNVNLVVKLYMELYQARNDFLHGNPVSRRHLFPFRNAKRPVLPHLAPLIYKTALLGYLQRFPFHQTPPKVNFEKLKDHHADFERALVQSLKRTPFEEGLLKATQDRQE